MSFWLTLLPATYEAYDSAGCSLKCALCDALSNLGTFCFNRLPDGQRTALLAFLSGCAIDDHEDPRIRGAELLERLIQAATKWCADDDKVRANAVRALGNLLQIL
ncbi:uncharacterized protein Dyak_GE16445 [Drosophila yakuba]|uniref:Uncharacterized protein n=1 Tax=Drosophila yakuba TaxID=7245 RepID=B4PZ80_DROYA|nr:uncharacterized protein Dyak_GE16445 [Drosophila yakuba]